LSDPARPTLSASKASLGDLARRRCGANVRHIAIPQPSLFDEIDDQAEAEADADVAEGRVVGHPAMKARLLSWGTPDELPPPDVGD
jgi:predicted transcriptional regulator